MDDKKTRGRPVKQTVDIESMKKLDLALGDVIDFRPVIAFTMRSCGATLEEIAQALDTSTQNASYHVQNIGKRIA